MQMQNSVWEIEGTTASVTYNILVLHKFKNIRSKHCIQKCHNSTRMVLLEEWNINGYGTEVLTVC
jgi:hypothetical protein